MVEVSVVTVKTGGREDRPAVSDNDRAGYYDEDELAELVDRYKDASRHEHVQGRHRDRRGLGRLAETLGRPVAQTDVYGSGPHEPGPLICPNCGAVVEDVDE